jgi:two-component system response regulator (stage 0 sporulation protein F)
MPELKKILIIDDTKPIRILLLKKFEKKYDCILCRTGKEGIQFLNETDDEISLIILDYMMPVMDGLQTMKLVRVFNKDVPVFVLSSTLNRERIVDLKKLGVSKFFAKPVHINRLVKEVKKLLG